MKREIWKPVVGFETHYSVSNRARIRRDAARKNRNLSPILKPYKLGLYNGVSFYRNGAVKKEHIHRIVAKAFIPGFRNDLEVNHKNGNKFDNSLKNLEWSTHQGNCAHAVATKLFNMKLTDVEVSTIQSLRTRIPLLGVKSIARRFRIHHKTVMAIWRNDNYRSKVVNL